MHFPSPETVGLICRGRVGKRRSVTPSWSEWSLLETRAHSHPSAYSKQRTVAKVAKKSAEVELQCTTTQHSTAAQHSSSYEESTNDGRLISSMGVIYKWTAATLTSQPLIASDLPGDEQREPVVAEGGGWRRRQVVQLAVEDVEAEVAHLGLADQELSALVPAAHGGGGGGGVVAGVGAALLTD